MDQPFDIGAVNAEILEHPIIHCSELANRPSPLEPDSTGASPAAQGHGERRSERLDNRSAGDNRSATGWCEIMHAIG